MDLSLRILLTIVTIGMAIWIGWVTGTILNLKDKTNALSPKKEN